MKQLQEIEKEITKMALSIGATDEQLPSYGESRDFGYPHIEVDDYFYHYVVVERGQELERISTSDFEELLYHVFWSATHDIAFKYELDNRIEDQDCRRLAFPKQVQLMNSISPILGVRAEENISDILRKNPYDDEPTKNANRIASAIRT
jgi:hypothetical protein